MYCVCVVVFTSIIICTYRYMHILHHKYMRVVRPWDPRSDNYFVVCCGPSYLMITSTTYASRYGPLKLGLPSNRLKICMYTVYNVMYLYTAYSVLCLMLFIVHCIYHCCVYTHRATTNIKCLLYGIAYHVEEDTALVYILLILNILFTVAPVHIRMRMCCTRFCTLYFSWPLLCQVV